MERVGSSGRPRGNTVEVSAFVEVDGKLYKAVSTELNPPGADSTSPPTVRAFALYTIGGKEVSSDNLSDEAVFWIYDKLDDELGAKWVDPEEAERLARRRKFFED